jgi:hypothetical protein
MFGALFLMEKEGTYHRMAGSSGDFVKVHKNIINILLNIPDRQHIFFLILLHAVIK